MPTRNENHGYLVYLQSCPRFPAHTHRLLKLCRIQAMGAAAERMLRYAVRPRPLASQRSSSNCERDLPALGATPGTGRGSNRAWGAHRERVERTLLSKQQAQSSQERRFESLRTLRAGPAASSCLLTGHRSYLFSSQPRVSGFETKI